MSVKGRADLSPAKIYFPVYVPGGGLSIGDLHFSQGDGEITFCGAIEMAGWLHLKVDVIKDGMSKYGIKNPIFKPSVITYQGISRSEIERSIGPLEACIRQSLLKVRK